MAIPKFLEDLLIISKLGDNPGADNGLSSSGLREKFDEAGVKIQKYINDTLIPALSGLSNPEEGLNMKNDIAMGGHRVTGLGDPVADGDAVPRGYANGHFAPAGYGLGEYPIAFDYSQIDTLMIPGRYRVNVNTTINNVYVSVAHMEVSAVNEYNVVQTLYTATCPVIILVRQNYGGVWQPWGCDNPPMVPGVEYRTTERIDGKVVYKIRFSFGQLPSNGVTNVATNYVKGVKNLTVTPNIYVMASDGVTIAWENNNPAGCNINVDVVSGNIWWDNTNVVFTDTRKGFVTLAYTKE